jgi:hypothetical protein
MLKHRFPKARTNLKTLVQNHDCLVELLLVGISKVKAFEVLEGA